MPGCWTSAGGPTLRWTRRSSAGWADSPGTPSPRTSRPGARPESHAASPSGDARAACSGWTRARGISSVSVAFDGTPTLAVDLDRPSPLAISCLARIGSTEAGGSLGIASRTAEALSGAGAGPPVLHGLSRHPRPLHLRPARQHPRAPPARAGPAATHPHAVPVLRPGQGVARRDRALSAPARRRLPLSPALHPPAPPPAALLRHAQPAGLPETGRRPGVRPDPVPERRPVRGPPPRTAATARTSRTRRGATHSTRCSSGITSRSRSAAPGSIAPDMLGRVFEGVMEPGARKQSGTYYTPRALVRSVLDAALAGFVGGRLGVSDAEALRRLSAGDERAVGLLDDITILDPAAGSGAFLLGALERLTAFRIAAGRDATPRAIVARQSLRRGPESGGGPALRAAALAGGHQRGNRRRRPTPSSPCPTWTRSCAKATACPIRCA